MTGTFPAMLTLLPRSKIRSFTERNNICAKDYYILENQITSEQAAEYEE